MFGTIDLSCVGGNGWLTKAPVCTSTPVSGSFDEAMAATLLKGTSKTQDTVSLSTGSYQQRLDKLKKLHESTDYSGMTDLEAMRLVEDRFRTAFGNETSAILNSLYGNVVGDNSIYTRISEQYVDQINESCASCIEKGPSARTLYRESGLKIDSLTPDACYLERYVRGYEKLSEDEIREKVAEQYSNGTLVDRYSAAEDLHAMGIDLKATWEIAHQIQQEMIKGTEAKYGHLFRDNPLRINAMISYAQGTKMSWSQLAKNKINAARTEYVYHASGELSAEEVKSRYLAELEECLGNFLQNMGRAERKLL